MKRKKGSVKREVESSTRSEKGQQARKKKVLELCLLHPKKKNTGISKEDQLILAHIRNPYLQDIKHLSSHSTLR